MTFWSHFRLAARGWARTPALAAVVIGTLSLGIGATTTAVAIADSVLVQPMPFPDAERLVWVTSYDTRASDSIDVYNSNRMSQFLQWQAHSASFEQLAAWSGTAAPDVYTVTDAGTPQRVNGLRVTQQLLPMLGAAPAIGRLFQAGDDAPDAPQYVLLSHDYWQRQFNSGSDVLGRVIRVDNVPHTIAGVLSASFPLSGSLLAGAPVDIYLPLELDPALDEIGAFMTVLGRLRPAVTLEQARADVNARHAALAAQRGRQWMAATAQRVVPLADLTTREARVPLLLLLGGVGCLLLVACANLANLLLVRSSGRHREMQIRTALGATVGQVFRQTVAESVVLGVAGGIGGVALALALTGVVRNESWLTVARLSEIDLNQPALVFALAMTVATTLLFGSLPLLHLRRSDLADALRAHTGITVSRRAAHTQRFVLVAQVALALLLTAAGSLLVRSFVELINVEPGFRPDRVVAMRIDPAGRLAPSARLLFFNRVLENASSVPGVESAALAIGIPMDRDFTYDVWVPGQPFEPGRDVAFARMVSPGYFATVGIPMASGRDFQASDAANAPLVVAVNETLARRVRTKGIEPLGATLTVSGRPRRVVAIVGDVKHDTLSDAATAEVYVPHAQTPAFFDSYDLVVRASEPDAIVPELRKAIWQVDADQAIGTPVELQELIARTLDAQRLLTTLLGGFAVAALLLAAVGVYGVVGYRLTQRTREIAIRLALGAAPWRVRALAVREAMGYVALGLAAGLPLTLAAGRLIGAFLFGVQAHDVPTLAAASAAVAAAAVAAALIPAQRAARGDAMAALRVE
jgi:predicted permease